MIGKGCSLIAVVGTLVIAHGAMASVTETQVTNDTSANHFNPAVSKGRIAFTVQPLMSGNSDIYVYDIAAGTTTRVTNTGSASLEDMDSTTVVYTDSVGGNLNIFYTDVTDASHTANQLTTDPASQSNPAISGNTVVWEDNRAATRTDIYGATIGASGEFIVTSAAATQHLPAISSGLVAWEDFRAGVESVWARDLSGAINGGAEFQVSTPGLRARNPDVEGSRIVFQMGPAAGTDDVWLWQGGVLVQLTSEIHEQRNPRISGNLVVWEDLRNDPAASPETNVDLYGYDLAAHSEIALETTPSSNQFLHDIDGNDLAFTDNRSGILQIWRLHFDNSTPTSTDPCDPSSGAPVLFDKTYTRGHGQPHWDTDSFASVDAHGTICLDLDHVTSAQVKLNGKKVFTPGDFNPSVTHLSKDVDLQSWNTLKVRLAGKPCHDNGGCGHHDDFTSASALRDHHDGDDGDDDDGDHGGDHGATCATMHLRVVGPVPMMAFAAPRGAAVLTAPENGSSDAACDVTGASTQAPAGFVASGLLFGLAAWVGRKKRV